MNRTTVQALLVGLLIAIWAWIAAVARLHVSVWPGVVALGCYFAAGGGVSGLRRTVLAAVSGVVWVLIYHAVRVAIGGGDIVAALLLGAVAFLIVLQARLPLLSFTAGAFAGAGVSLGFGVDTVNEAIRVAVALAAGAVVGFAAERLADAIGARRGRRA
jgi:hypothetical protein